MNSGEKERLWKLQTSANSLVLEGKKKAGPLLDYLQVFVFGNALPDIDWLETHKALGLQDEYREWAKTLVLPTDRPDLWIMPMVKGVTSNKIVAGHKKLGVIFWLYDANLDAAVPTHDRDANRDSSYVVGFRCTVEADQENADKSANDLANISHKGIVLPERLMLGAGFYVATGQHLDTKTVTLCTGSRRAGGLVPGVRFYSDNRKVYVDWDSPDNLNASLRSRSVRFFLPA